MTRRVAGFGLAIEGAQPAKAAAGLPRVFLSPNAVNSGPADIVVLVGDKFGRVIGELDCEVVGIAWKLSDYGQARMVLPRGEATATERLLRPGNRVLIQFGNGLPDWGGMLDLPRRWRDGRIEIVAYSGEYILKWRISAADALFVSTPPGDIFQLLLAEALPSGVTFDQVWSGGERRSAEYHYRDLYDIFKKDLTSQADWDVRPYLLNGNISFLANYYDRRGTDHGWRLALLEGVNAVDVDMQEQGPIINDWRLAGTGTGWGEGERLYAAAGGEISQSRYGLRQKGEVRVDVGDQSTLDQSAAVAISAYTEPAEIVGLSSLDLPPARWSQYDVGDTIWVELYSAGFGGYGSAVRLLAREYLPGQGVCSLVIEQA